MCDPSRIAALIGRLGWTQPMMAEFLGVKQATVSRLVNGQSETGPVSRLLDALAAEKDFPDLTAERFTWNKPGTDGGAA